LRAGLETLAAHSPLFTGVRGRGLMRALVLAPAWRQRAGDFIAAARARGVLVTRGGDDAIRLLPPLVVSDDEIASGIAMLEQAATDLAPRPRRAGAALDPAGGMP
jgi:acetylornithine/succinyldiaminopimelate/putrescine aminotransferase